MPADAAIARSPGSRRIRSAWRDSAPRPRRHVTDAEHERSVDRVTIGRNRAPTEPRTCRPRGPVTRVVISVRSSAATVASGRRPRIAFRIEDADRGRRGRFDGSLNQTWISRGADSITAPAAGCDRSSSACGQAGRGKKTTIPRTIARCLAIAGLPVPRPAIPACEWTESATSATSSEDPPSHIGVRDCSVESLLGLTGSRAARRRTDRPRPEPCSRWTRRRSYLRRGPRFGGIHPADNLTAVVGLIGLDLVRAGRSRAGEKTELLVLLAADFPARPRDAGDRARRVPLHLHRPSGRRRKRSTSKCSGKTTLSEIVGTSFSVGTRRTYSVELFAGAFLGVMVTCAPAATGTRNRARTRSVLRITGGVLLSATRQSQNLRLCRSLARVGIWACP